MSQDPRRFDAGDAQRVPDELLDAFFDGDLDDAGKRCLFDGMRRDPAAAERFARTMFALEQLRRTPDASASPDFTDSVLDAIDQRKRWMTPAARRVVRIGRYAAAASILVMLAGGFLYKRANPQSALIAERPAPLTNVVETGRLEARQNIQSMASVFRPLRGAVAGLHESRSPAPQPPSVAIGEYTDLHVVRFIAPTELPAESPWRSRLHTTTTARSDAVPAGWTFGRAPAAANTASWARPATLTTQPEKVRVILIPGG